MATIAPTPTSVCRCGATALSTVGAPIAVATCYCESCKTAAREFEETGAGPILTADGGVDYIVFRKDRVAILRGGNNLTDRRLTAGSPTRRVIATCCHSAMFLDFAPGYWLSLYRSGFGEQSPSPTVRTYTARFVLKLIGAWASMGFRRPRLPF